MLRNIIATAMLLAFVVPTPSASAPADPSLKELRQSFTVHGKPVPPEVMADFGDADMADSGPIRVTIDLLAAIGSNLYFDDISVAPNGWVSQKKQVPNGATTVTEEMGYSFDGVTRNGLLVVTSSFSGGGSGNFIYLHILDAAPARALDEEGKPYDRLNLTNIRTISLGDRWDGDIKINGDTIAITTAARDPQTYARKPGTQLIQAARP